MNYLKSFTKLDNIEKSIFFLTVLFLPTQLGKHFWPEFSFIYSLRIDYLSPTLYFWDFLVFLLITIWVYQGKKVNVTALSFLLFFWLTQILSLIFANNLGAGLVRGSQYLMSGLFGLYIASQKFEYLKEKLFWGLLIAVIYESLLALDQFLVGGSVGLWILGERSFNLSTPTIATFNFVGQVFLRPYGTFSHPNVLSAFLVLSLFLLYFLNKKVNLIWIVIGFGAAILTFSRASIGVLLLESFIIFKKRLGVLLIIFLLVLPFIFVRFESVFNFDSLSITRREELSLIAINQFWEKPITGVGLNNFIDKTANSTLVSGPNRFLQPVHNIFLLTLAETGALGLVGLLVLISSSFIVYQLKQKTSDVNPRMNALNNTALAVKLRRNHGREPVELHKQRKEMVVMFLVVLFLGMFDHYFLTLPQGQRMFFLIWGLGMLR